MTRIVINVIAIIIIAFVIGLQFSRTKNLYDKKLNENKEEFHRMQGNSSDNDDSTTNH